MELSFGHTASLADVPSASWIIHLFCRPLHQWFATLRPLSQLSYDPWGFANSPAATDCRRIWDRQRGIISAPYDGETQTGWPGGMDSVVDCRCLPQNEKSMGRYSSMWPTFRPRVFPCFQNEKDGTSDCVSVRGPSTPQNSLSLFVVPLRSRTSLLPSQCPRSIKGALRTNNFDFNPSVACIRGKTGVEPKLLTISDRDNGHDNRFHGSAYIEYSVKRRS